MVGFIDLFTGRTLLQAWRALDDRRVVQQQQQPGAVDGPSSAR